MFRSQQEGENNIPETQNHISKIHEGDAGRNDDDWHATYTIKDKELWRENLAGSTVTCKDLWGVWGIGDLRDRFYTIDRSILRLKDVCVGNV